MKNHHDDIATVISKAALHHYYNCLPTKGKPTPHKEWTVYAAIVATSVLQKDKNELHSKTNGDGRVQAWVVSSATGSKCTAINSCMSAFSNINLPTCNLKKKIAPAMDIHERNTCCNPLCQEQWKGIFLHDSHAEVLARRGLIKTLWKEIHMDLTIQTNESKNGRDIVEMDNSYQQLLQRVCKPTKDNTIEISYELKESVQLHLYISDSPCGDCSIYAIAPEFKTVQNSTTNFTGAKIILPPRLSQDDETATNFSPCEFKDTEEVQIAREKVQVISALRLKSGRSNLPAHLRSSSMSCSDKICKWMVLGLQGSGLLSCFLNKPIMLSNVVVSHDKKARMESQQKALHRALIERATSALEVASTTCASHEEWSSLPSVPLLQTQVHVCNDSFSQSKAVADAESLLLSIKNKQDVESLKNDVTSKKRKHDNMIGDSVAKIGTEPKSILSPSGMSINWQYSSHDARQNKLDAELTVGAKGMKQGKKPKDAMDLIRLSSRLSRRALLIDSLECIRMIKNGDFSLHKLSHENINSLLGIDHQCSRAVVRYQWTKQVVKGGSRLLKDCIFQTEGSPLVGWVRSSEDHDFLHHP